MFLENVKHILKVIEYIKKSIDDNGYHLQLFQISPHQYGIPQQRERVYFVCIRKDIIYIMVMIFTYQLKIQMYPLRTF